MSDPSVLHKNISWAFKIVAYEDANLPPLVEKILENAPIKARI